MNDISRMLLDDYDNKRQSMLPEFGNGVTFQSEFLKFNAKVNFPKYERYITHASR